MITPTLKDYEVKIYGGLNEYGQPGIPTPAGTVKMSVSILTESVDPSSLYSNAQYIGFTYNKEIDNNYIVSHEDGDLKVLYVMKANNRRIVYLAKV